ncbi:MAG: hypothetical protein J0G96_06450 [Flavobacteriia bacterium]|nr:hypothetical protein [Flavobacteriia bacterium]OJX36577.1 MAG: hypothetical protein BGO87_12300 [Flavobacteriia bacterium 40-80]
MKTKVLIISVLALLAVHTVFGQKKQTKIMLQQIALLEIQKSQVKKYYDIAKKGLKEIGSWTNGEKKAHDEHFKSLNNVSSAVKNHLNVAQTKQLRQKIAQITSKTYTEATGSAVFPQSELAYFKRVFARLNNDCNVSVEMLQSVTTDGKMQMTDDERLKRIDDIHEHMTDNYTFVKSFCRDIKMMMLSRRGQKADNDRLRQLYGID